MEELQIPTMKRLSKLIALLLVLSAATVVYVRAEDDVDADQEQVDEKGDDQAQEMADDAVADGYYQDFEGDDAAYVNKQGDDYYWLQNNNNNYYYAGGNNGQQQNGNQGDDDSVYKSQVQICSDAVIQVQDVTVYCDSPGTFYYGSGKYRNNQYCLPGDKATIQVDFYIAYQNIIQQSGNKAILDIYANGGSYTDVAVYDSADLCSLSSLKRKSRSQCPYNGYYQVKTHFYWGSDVDTESFLPTITVGFKSSAKKQVYDFGGANTDLCRGSTFLTWSDGVRVSYANAMGTFLKTFGVLLITIIMMGFFAFFLSKRPRSFKEAKSQLIESNRNFISSVKKLRRPRLTARDLSIHEGEEFDFQKIQTAGNRDLVDF